MPEDKVYAFVVEGDVIGTIHVPTTAPGYDRLVAGLSSGPEVIDATTTPGVKFGWTYDGTSFTDPTE